MLIRNRLCFVTFFFVLISQFSLSSSSVGFHNCQTCRFMVLMSLLMFYAISLYTYISCCVFHRGVYVVRVFTGVRSHD